MRKRLTHLQKQQTSIALGNPICGYDGVEDYTTPTVDCVDCPNCIAMLDRSALCGKCKKTCDILLADDGPISQCCDAPLVFGANRR